MTLIYTVKLGLKVWPSNVENQKIDGSLLEIFGMVLPVFRPKISLKESGFFKNPFLLPILLWQ